MTRHDKTRQGKTRQHKGRQDKTRQDMPRQDKTRAKSREGHVQDLLFENAWCENAQLKWHISQIGSNLPLYFNL
jgi:hypothetical protein